MMTSPDGRRRPPGEADDGLEPSIMLSSRALLNACRGRRRKPFEVGGKLRGELIERRRAEQLAEIVADCRVAAAQIRLCVSDQHSRRLRVRPGRRVTHPRRRLETSSSSDKRRSHRPGCLQGSQIAASRTQIGECLDAGGEPSPASGRARPRDGPMLRIQSTSRFLSPSRRRAPTTASSSRASTAIIFAIA